NLLDVVRADFFAVFAMVMLLTKIDEFLPARRSDAGKNSWSPCWKKRLLRKPDVILLASMPVCQRTRPVHKDRTFIRKDYSSINGFTNTRHSCSVRHAPSPTVHCIGGLPSKRK